MSTAAAPASPPPRTAPRTQGNVRLRGRHLVVGRAITRSLSIAGPGVSLATPPARFDQLRILAGEQGLDIGQLGLSDTFFGWYVVLLDVAVVATCCLLGAVLIARRSDERMA